MQNKCPECGSGKISTEYKEIICKECGLILDEIQFKAQ